ncbi:MAG TPA: hypothetical protein VGB27_09695 [Candidatus Binatia bacterium]
MQRFALMAISTVFWPLAEDPVVLTSFAKELLKTYKSRTSGESRSS